MVLMFSLLRKLFETFQSTHDHDHDVNNSSTNSDTGHRLFLQIGKAKRTLTSSFENLKSKVGNINYINISLLCYGRVRRQVERIKQRLRYSNV